MASTDTELSTLTPAATPVPAEQAVIQHDDSVPAAEVSAAPTRQHPRVAYVDGRRAVMWYAEALVGVSDGALKPEDIIEAKQDAMNFVFWYLACRGIPFPKDPEQESTEDNSFVLRFDYAMRLALGDCDRAINNFLTLVSKMFGCDAEGTANDARVFCAPVIYVAAREFYRTNREAQKNISQHIASCRNELDDSHQDAFMALMDQFQDNPGSFFSVINSGIDDAARLICKWLPCDVHQFLTNGEPGQRETARMVGTTAFLISQEYKQNKTSLLTFLIEFKKYLADQELTLAQWKDKVWGTTKGEGFYYEGESMYRQMMKLFQKIFLDSVLRFVGLPGYTVQVVQICRKNRLKDAFYAIVDRVLVRFWSKQNAWGKEKILKRAKNILQSNDGQPENPRELLVNAKENNGMLYSGDPINAVGPVLLRIEADYFRTFRGQAEALEVQNKNLEYVHELQTGIWKKCTLMTMGISDACQVQPLVRSIMEGSGYQMMTKTIGVPGIRDLLRVIKNHLDVDGHDALQKLDLTAMCKALQKKRWVPNPTCGDVSEGEAISSEDVSQSEPTTFAEVDRLDAVDRFWALVHERFDGWDKTRSAITAGDFVGDVPQDQVDHLHQLEETLHTTREPHPIHTDPYFTIMTVLHLLLRSQSIKIVRTDPKKLVELNVEVQKFRDVQAKEDPHIPKAYIETIDKDYAFRGVFQSGNGAGSLDAKDTFLWTAFITTFASTFYEHVVDMSTVRPLIAVLNLPLSQKFVTEKVTNVGAAPQCEGASVLETMSLSKLNVVTQLNLTLSVPLFMNSKQIDLLMDATKYKKNDKVGLESHAFSSVLWAEAAQEAIKLREDFLVQAMTNFRIVYTA